MEFNCWNKTAIIEIPKIFWKCFWHLLNFSWFSVYIQLMCGLAHLWKWTFLECCGSQLMRLIQLVNCNCRNDEWKSEIIHFCAIITKGCNPPSAVYMLHPLLQALQHSIACCSHHVMVNTHLPASLLLSTPLSHPSAQCKKERNWQVFSTWMKLGFPFYVLCRIYIKYCSIQWDALWLRIFHRIRTI